MARFKSKKITDSARLEECQTRIPGHCNFDPETTVPAHENGGGMGTKQSDLFIAYECSACHAVVDGHAKSEHPRALIDLWHLQGILRTQRILLEKGLVKLA